jgi:hypothetical protein
LRDPDWAPGLTRVTAKKSRHEICTFKKSSPGILRPLVIILLLILNGQSVLAAELSLAWNSSVGATGYRVYYGFEPRSYIFEVDLGLWTRCTISDLEYGRNYYFAVTAYNDYAESDFSKEISYAPIPCNADLDMDGDIDGLDLAEISTAASLTTPRDFAARFGTDSCDN